MDALTLIEDIAEAAGVNLDLDGATRQELRRHEVLLATQPNYPLAHEIGGVAPNSEVENTDDGDSTFGEKTIWIAEGSQHYDHPYAPRAVFR